MTKSENGFTYPLTLCVLIIFLLFLSFRVEQLLTERKVAQQTKIILQEEYYFLSSLKKVEKMLQSGGATQSKGTFKFENGSMDYQVETPIGTVRKVNFTLHLNPGIIVIGRGFYDIKLKRIIKWVEMS